MIYGLAVIVISGVDYSWLPISLMIAKVIISGIAYYIFTVMLLTLLPIVRHMSKTIEFKNSLKHGDE